MGAHRSTDTLGTSVGSGTVLSGRYLLSEKIGQGGCSIVYAAHDELLDRDVAVKVWTQSLGDTDEGRVTARLNHPGVVVVHDAASHGDVRYLVMELVEGHSLAEELRDGPMSRERAAAVVGRLATTLSLVHADDVVHGDVKPANVLLGNDGAVTLADFGVAGAPDQRPRDVVHGTPQYLSPEQVRGRPITAASDVYALGLVLLECLTGTTTYPGDATAAAAARLDHDPPIPTWVDPALATLVREMTSRTPVRRPTAAQVAHRLQGRGAPHETQLLALPMTQPYRPEGRPWWLAVAGAVVGLTVLLAVTGPSPEAYAPPPAPSPSAPAPPAPRATPSPVVKAPVVAPVQAKGKGHKKHGHH